MTSDSIIIAIIVLVTTIIVRMIFKKQAYADLAIGVGGVITSIIMYLSDSKLAPAWIVAAIGWIVISYAWRDLKKKKNV